mgnify:CR=1 FL=1|tara:strand:+ start:1887 stop:2627 length:741 start_codon:yes stop_codon:yes gene_type:complete
MSLKSLIQVTIFLIIIIILGSVYFNYFSNYNKLTSQENETAILDKSKENAEDVALNITEEKKLKEETSKKVEQNISDKSDLNPEKKNDIQNVEAKTKLKKPEIKNLVKDVEYLTTDRKGNKYKILATSGRTNMDNKDILDLDNVRGIITSSKRSTVYIVSDFAEYNSSDLNSKFYQNVVINYEDKEITCDYFDVDMETNIAIAYNNVVVTDPKSIMKAGKIILNIETKVININPNNEKKKISVITK